MQMQKDNMFYSNIAGLDVEAYDDRKLLVQEQKACRVRARQYSRETNRRRKMLEDRKRQQDIQEKRQMENILQQRKQRLQEDTERFQRAHLPPSQRRRPAFCTRVPNLDEALRHIQGDQTCYIHHTSFLPVTPTISRSTVSSKPPGGSSGPRNLRAVSATQAYDKLTQERSLGDFKTSQLLFSNQLQENLPKDQEQPRTQEHSDIQISHAESLSSLDSLENEVPQHGHGNKPDSLDPPEVHDTRRPASLQRQLNCPSPSSNHCPPKRFLEKVISQHGLPSSSRSSSPSPVEDESANEAPSVQNFLKTAEQFDITGQYHTSNIQATFSCQKQVLAINSVHTEYQYGTTFQENISRDKSTISVHCKMQTAPGTLPLEYSSMAQQSNSGELSKCAKHPSEMHAAQKASRNVYGSVSDLNKVSPSLENSALQTVEAEKSFLSTKRKPDEDAVLVLERRTQLGSFDKYKRAEHPNLANEYSDRRLAEAILPKSSKMTEEPDKTSVDTLANHTDLNSNNVRFLKGILKKKFKCIGDGDAKFRYTPGNFSFSKQVAIAIRDSLELIRSKRRDQESNKCIQKKLRWFDEVNGNGGENKKIVTKELSKQAEGESRLTQPPQQPLLDQQHGSWCMNIPSGILKNNKTSSGPVDPNSTKQAWSDVGPQKGKQQEPTGESRMKKAASCTTGQAHSGRTGSGTTSFQARRGTMIRPQCSSQVQHIVRTQGKVLVPRPPPRSEVTGGNSGQAMMYITKTGNYDECSQDKARLAVEQVLYKDYPEGQPVPQHHILKTDEGTILAPVPPSYACKYETVSKGIYTRCQSDSQIGRGSNGFQKGILDRTPTDEEISLLWHGVRSALASKDVRSPARRPTMENNMVKNSTAALGYKKPPVLHQATVPITASKTDQMVPDQGSKVMGGDEQVAVDLAQFQRAAEFLQSQRGLSALSLEEQKLLQSLDRLNHRLQYVQDVTAGNTALRGIVALDSAYNQSPQPGKRSCATLRKYHDSSAHSHTRPHTRY
ncbi:centrosomal protein of 126 kDa isoform X2 [Ictalurus furcatus]|uniref:centrosomal protein of 126 kDa isoform X2 n=1 Tax=Ictalurus furcatus TaxID=66913 RepID=UPI00234FB892|nr:centrosomal protein of 126 kDa isoform X2 [Ictalurus furcatus]